MLKCLFTFVGVYCTRYTANWVPDDQQLQELGAERAPMPVRLPVRTC